MKRINEKFKFICALTAGLLLTTPISVLNASATAGAGGESSPFELAGTAGVDVRKFSHSSAKFTFTISNRNLIINFVDSQASIAIPNAILGSSFTFSAPTATSPSIILDSTALSQFKPHTTNGDVFRCMLQADGTLFTSRLSDGKVEIIMPKPHLPAVAQEVPIVLSVAEASVPIPLCRPEDFYLRDFKLMDNNESVALQVARRFLERGNQEKAIEFLEKNIKKGHCESMIALGEIRQQRREFDIAYKWFLLALETNWVTTKVESVTDAAKAKLQEVFECLPPQRGISPESHDQFLESFKASTSLQTITGGVKLPVMLSEEDTLRRRLSIEATQCAGEEHPWTWLGDKYDTQGQKEIAIICYERCGSTISSALLGYIYDDNGNYEKARCYYERGGDYYNLAVLYSKKLILSSRGRSPEDEAVECYQKAIAAYVREGRVSPLAYTLINLASVLVFEGFGDVDITLIPRGKTREQYARDCLALVASLPISEIRESSQSLWKLAQGDLCLRDLADPNKFEKAAGYYSAANSPEGWSRLGNMYDSGKIKPPIGKNQSQAAFECYQKSGTPQSMCNAGILYEKGKISSQTGLNQFQAAEACYKKSKQYNAYFGLLGLYKYHYMDLGLSFAQTVAKQQEATKSLYQVLAQESIETRLYGWGYVEQINENYEAALHWYHQALHLGYEKPRDNYIIVQNILSARHRRNELATALKISGSSPKPDAAPMADDTTATDAVVVDDMTAKAVGTSGDISVIDKVEISASTPKLDTALMADDITATDAVVVDDMTAKAVGAGNMSVTDRVTATYTKDEDVSSDSEATVAASFQDFPTYESIEEEMAAAEAELQRAIEYGKAKLTMIATSSSVTREMAAAVRLNVENSPRLNFHSQELKAQYLGALDTTTLRECMEELLGSEKPWEKISRGQPEVLSHPFKKHRGCHSLHLNETDRFVYKVNGQNILILNVFGHYDDQNKK